MSLKSLRQLIPSIQEDFIRLSFPRAGWRGLLSPMVKHKHVTFLFYKCYYHPVRCSVTRWGVTMHCLDENQILPALNSAAYQVTHCGLSHLTMRLHFVWPSSIMDRLKWGPQGGFVSRGPKACVVWQCLPFDFTFKTIWAKGLNSQTPINLKSTCWGCKSKNL